MRRTNPAAPTHTRRSSVRRPLRRSFSASVAGVALAAAALAATAAPALADPLEDAVAARRGYYQLIGLHTGALVAMARGEAEYVAEDAQAHADNLKALAGLRLSYIFPEGTDNQAMAGMTRATPAIWSDVPGFRTRHGALAAATETLAAQAGQGRGALGAALGDVGASCKACHDDYRAEDF